jgi:hypothetical protein
VLGEDSGRDTWDKRIMDVVGGMLVDQVAHGELRVGCECILEWTEIVDLCENILVVGEEWSG